MISLIIIISVLGLVAFNQGYKEEIFQRVEFTGLSYSEIIGKLTQSKDRTKVRRETPGLRNLAKQYEDINNIRQDIETSENVQQVEDLRSFIDGVDVSNAKSELEFNYQRKRNNLLLEEERERLREERELEERAIAAEERTREIRAQIEKEKPRLSDDDKRKRANARRRTARLEQKIATQISLGETPDL